MLSRNRLMKFLAERRIFAELEAASLFVYLIFNVALQCILFWIDKYWISIDWIEKAIEYAMVTEFIFCTVICIWLCVIRFKEKSLLRKTVSIILICSYIVILFLLYFLYKIGQASYYAIFCQTSLVV